MLLEPTYLSPTSGGKVIVFASDRGGHATEAGANITITDTLPVGTTPTEVELKQTTAGFEPACTILARTVTCTYPHVLQPLNQEQLVIPIHVSVTPEVGATPTTTATVQGGGAREAATSAPLAISAQTPGFGIADFSTYAADPAGERETQAGGHPNALVTTFDVNGAVSSDPSQAGRVDGVQDIKDVVADLPLGFIGDPQATPKCPQSDLTGETAFQCPRDTFVGTVALNTPSESFGSSSLEAEPSPVVNVQPEAGYAAQFAFTLGSNSVMFYAKVVHTPAGYRVRVVIPGITRFIKAKGATLTFFGDPKAQEPFGNQPGTPAALFTSPADCTSSEVTTTLHVDSWQEPASVPLKPDGSSDYSGEIYADPRWKSATAVSPPVSGCDRLRFLPTITVQPDTTQTASPSGVNIGLQVPQSEDPNGLATPPLKNITLTLPQGMVINPSSADGLQACSDAQIALSATEAANCPDASVLGTIKVHTPLLTEPLEGRMFLGSPLCGPCSDSDAQSGRLVRLFIEVASPARGIDIKLPGTVSVDPSTGRLTASFSNNPQLPFDDLKLRLNSGPRAPLVTPRRCGQATTTSDITPWSTPYTPDATPSSSFVVDQGCAPQFAPVFSTGTVTNQAGGYGPLATTVTRPDGNETLNALQLQLPPGLIGMLSSVAQCATAQANTGTCPAASAIGRLTVAVGAGTNPLYLPVAGQLPNAVYLTGPYRGAPFGLAFVVPAIAGPFNLGTVVVRAAISIDPNTAQVTVTSDPLPQILDGVPLQVRNINVTIDRPGFTFNPTNCEALRVTGTISSAQGSSVAVASPFQAAGCSTLPFKPVFAVSTAGRASRPSGASLDVRVTAKGGPQPGGGEANIHSVKVLLPPQLPSRLSTLNKACLASVFEANPARCPAESAVGTATAVTPVLAHPLSGPAYLVSHGGAAFPDLEIVLQGEGIVLVLDGKTDIKHGITSSTFGTVPDAPISAFELKLPTGRFSILTAYLPSSAGFNLCRQHLTMPTTITAQNGAVIKQTTGITVTGCPRAQHPSRGHRARKATRHTASRRSR